MVGRLHVSQASLSKPCLLSSVALQHEPGLSDDGRPLAHASLAARGSPSSREASTRPTSVSEVGPRISNTAGAGQDQVRKQGREEWSGRKWRG